MAAVPHGDRLPSLRGDELPAVHGAVPGPESRDLAARLARVESRNITLISHDFPIFWSEARGAAVRDADGNVYVDLTAGFGVAQAGHAPPAVTAAIAAQAARLAHGLGDVHPPDSKVALLERLAALAPGNLGVTILGSAGAEAVEAALKTALLRTGRAGVLAFEGGYHGLTCGALALTHRPDFRAPFDDVLFQGVGHAPFPDEHDPASLDRALAAVDRLLAAAEGSAYPIGAIVVEPILGRGGLIVPPPSFLEALRERCDGERRLLILDEVYTGIGRTGRWFACEHDGVVPDVLVIGKALTGSVPLSAAIGTPDAMSAWPASEGEALHTSTFLGNPIACAAALAQLDTIEDQGLVARAALLGERIRERTTTWLELPAVHDVRGRGLLQGVALERGEDAVQVMHAAMRRGVLLLPEGPYGNVLALTPPAVITEAQLDAALDVVQDLLECLR